MIVKKSGVIIFLIFAVPITVLLVLVCFFHNPPPLPEFTILNGECLFEINTNGVQVLHNNRLKVIIDDREYYIQLYPTSFYREVTP